MNLVTFIVLTLSLVDIHLSESSRFPDQLNLPGTANIESALRFPRNVKRISEQSKSDKVVIKNNKLNFGY